MFVEEPLLDIVIPTYNRPAALAVTLSTLISQSFRSFNLLISDQSNPSSTSFLSPELNAVLNVLYCHGHCITLYRHLPRRGMAEHRQFLLEQVQSRYVLYMDDDLILEPYVIDLLISTILAEGCGFVGSAVIGLSYCHDVRPHEQQIELWQTKVSPEVVRPSLPSWHRYRLHNAANLYHVQRNLCADPAHPLMYHVAWIGGCVLYDTEKLRSVGGFSFWSELPEQHVGEDVLAELRVMEKFGGCGVLPSGVYHQELVTTIPYRQVDAPKYLPF